MKSYLLGWSPLGNLTSRILPNFDARKHSGDFEYIEIGDVSVGDGAYTTTKINSKDLPANAKIKLSGGEILFSQVRPTRGAIAIVNDELDHPTISSGAFYVCKASDINNREILWLYLRSIRNVFEKYCGGTSYPTIDSRYIAKFPIPHFAKILPCVCESWSPNQRTRSANPTNCSNKPKSASSNSSRRLFSHESVAGGF